MCPGAGRRPAPRSGYYRQPQRRAVRPAPAEGDVWAAHRHLRLGYALAGLTRVVAKAVATVNFPETAESGRGHRTEKIVESDVFAASRGGKRLLSLLSKQLSVFKNPTYPFEYADPYSIPYPQRALF